MPIITTSTHRALRQAIMAMLHEDVTRLVRERITEIENELIDIATEAITDITTRAYESIKDDQTAIFTTPKIERDEADENHS